jgi:hypothetical protein
MHHGVHQPKGAAIQLDLPPASFRQLAHCIQRYETEVFAKVIWGADRLLA